LTDNILVFNAGSATLKFALYEVAAGVAGTCVLRDQVDLAPASADATVREAIVDIERRVGSGRVAAVGHRIVHGGSRYTQPVLLDERVVAELEELRSLAPLHQGHGLAVVDVVRRTRPTVVQVAAFDTMFHSTMPDVARRFALPQVWFDRGVRRYGFHGLSYEFISGRLRELSTAHRTCMDRVVVAHLGSGASLCALRDGASIATTMSFTPTDGLMMATRSGALDPSVVSYLLRERAMSAAEIDRLLNAQSGLLGVSGISGDIRELIGRDDPHARLAVDLFVYRIVVEIGALIAALRGVDAIVFTGGIGTHQAQVRQRICDAFSWLGAQCDPARNERHETRFDTTSGAVVLWNIPTDEESVIARHTARLFALAT
jgi:acetate kinase